eukprot:jgi/Chlat1/3572/Chrsp234S03596
MAGKVSAATSPPPTPSPSPWQPVCCGRLMFFLGWFCLVGLWVCVRRDWGTYGMTSHCVVTLDNTTTVVASLATVTAAFGPLLPPGGVQGVLFQLTPADGCSPAAHADKDGAAWIALIAKGNCGFHDKVLNAQLAGAAAAIIYDNEDAQSPMLMTAKNASGIRMSTVFMSKADGQLLHLIVAGNQQRERVTALLKPDVYYVVANRIVHVIGALIWSLFCIACIAIGLLFCLPPKLVTPSDEKDAEDVVVVVNCKVAPPLASVGASDGLSKLDDGEGAMTKLETAPLLQGREINRK